MTHNLLKGKRGIIFGALNSESIAWKVAEKAVEEGATITLSNTPMALRMGQLNELSENSMHQSFRPTPQALKTSKWCSRRAWRNSAARSTLCSIQLA